MKSAGTDVQSVPGASSFSGPARPAGAARAPGAAPGPARPAPAAAERAESLLRSLGLPRDRASFLAVSALIGEGLALRAESIRALRAAIAKAPARHPGDAELRARLAARALALGLEPGGASLERAFALCSRATDGGQAAVSPEGLRIDPDSRSDGDGAAPNGDGRHGAPGGDGTAGGNADAGEADAGDAEAGPERGGSGPRPQAGVMLEQGPDGLLPALAKALPSFVAKAMADPDLASLARPGDSGKGWIFAPFSIRMGDVDFWGYFRILYDKDTRKTERMAADIRDAGGSRVLELRGGADGTLVRYRCDDGDEAHRFVADLYPLAAAAPLAGSGAEELEGYGAYDIAAE